MGISVHRSRLQQDVTGDHTQVGQPDLWTWGLVSHILMGSWGRRRMEDIFKGLQSLTFPGIGKAPNIRYLCEWREFSSHVKKVSFEFLTNWKNHDIYLLGTPRRWAEDTCLGSWQELLRKQERAPSRLKHAETRGGGQECWLSSETKPENFRNMN